MPRFWIICYCFKYQITSVGFPYLLSTSVRQLGTANGMPWKTTSNTLHYLEGQFGRISFTLKGSTLGLRDWTFHSCSTLDMTITKQLSCIFWLRLTFSFTFQTQYVVAIWNTKRNVKELYVWNNLRFLNRRFRCYVLSHTKWKTLFVLYLMFLMLCYRQLLKWILG